MRRVFHGPLDQPGRNYPASIDWSHPLATGLIGCYLPSYLGGISTTVAPSLRDLTGIGPELACQDIASTIVTSPPGIAAYNTNTGGTNGGWQATLGAAQRPSFGVSLFVRCYKAANGFNINTFPMLLGCQWTNGNTAPYDTWDIVHGPTNDQINFNLNVAGTAYGVSRAGQIVNGGTYNFGLAAQADGVAGNVRPFINGALQTTANAPSGSIGYGTTPTLCLNGKVGTIGGSGMQVSCGYIWNRKLSDDLMVWLNAEPYAFLRPVVRRRWIIPAATRAPNGPSVTMIG